MNPGRPKVRDLTGPMPRRRYDVISSGHGCPALEDKRCAYDERNEQNGFYRDVFMAVVSLVHLCFCWLMLKNKKFYSKNFLLFYFSAGFSFLAKSPKNALLIRPKTPFSFEHPRKGYALLLSFRCSFEGALPLRASSRGAAPLRSLLEKSRWTVAVTVCFAPASRLQLARDIAAAHQRRD